MTDTISVDTLQLAEWRRAPEFDYSAEFKGSGFSIIDWLGDKLDQIWRTLFGDASLGVTEDVIWFVLGFGAIATIIVYTLYRHPELLRWRRKAGQADESYTIEEDNIYGIDFTAAISHAIQLGDYRGAVRLIYLKTLRSLSDAGKIDWQPAKTPSQYVAEYTNEPFIRLTATFVRVRYGGYEATKKTVDEALHEINAIKGEEEINERHA